MEKIRIAILGASEIAFRRFLPALLKDSRFEYVGVAFYRKEDQEKVKLFQKTYGGKIFDSFEKVYESNQIDAVYVPQPPALHYEFGMKVLQSGKHLLMEKPFTTSLRDTSKIVEYAKNNDLAVTENYMFQFHKQIELFKKISYSGKIGEIVGFSVRFCFPLRSTNDFRYSKQLGGGALLDCGGYTIMLSDILTNREGILHANKPVYESQFEVDMHGSGFFDTGSLKCDYYFGMNDEYDCSATAIGTKGKIVANRILTAPPDFDVVFKVYDINGNITEEIEIGKDDSFLKSIDNFYNCIINKGCRKKNLSNILRQAKLINDTIIQGGY